MPEFHERVPYNPKERPLTEIQKKRAESWPSCDIPHKMARKHCKGFEENYERLYGFAVVSYLLCARSFDPAENRLGEDGWRPFACHWTEKSMLAQEARYWRQRDGVEVSSLDAPNEEGESSLAAKVVDNRRPEEVSLEVREEHDRIMSKLRGLERAAVFLCVREGHTLQQAADRLDVTKERVRQLVNSAIEKIKMAELYGGRNSPDSGDRLKKVRSDPAIEQKRLSRLRKAMKVRSRALRAMGAIPRGGWYIGVPDGSLLYGPYETAEKADALLPRPVGREAGFTHKAVQIARKERGEPFVVGWSHAHKYKKGGWKAMPRREFKPGCGTRAMSL